MRKFFSTLSLLIILLLSFSTLSLAANHEASNKTAGVGNERHEYFDIDDDEDEPEVLKATIVNVTDTGFDITADFYSYVGLSKAYFLTWTKNNGKDDLVRPWPEVNLDGGKTASYTFHVNIADHDNETGLYCVEVYCRDIYGELSDDYELKIFIGEKNNNRPNSSQDGKLLVTVQSEPENGGTVTGGGQFNKGEGSSVTASPNDGFEFIGWFNKGQLISTDRAYSFYVSNNTNLVAKFKSTNTENLNPTPSPEVTQETLIDVYRLYNNKTGEHLYTISQDEVKALLDNGWNYEGIGWHAPSSGQPVYRLFNSVLNEHIYTIDQKEIKALTDGKDWSVDFGGESIFFSGGTKPIYRLYNDVTSKHHLTVDEFEYNILPSQGWKQEGISLYAVE